MKAIIPAAWYGTRMLPITKTIPKELLPVWNKPVIQYIVEWLASGWIKDICMITSQWKQALEDYFDKNYELEEILKKKWKIELLKEVNKTKNLANISFVKQKEQLGLPHAVLSAKAWVTWDFFILVLGDMIFSPAIYQDMLDVYRQYRQPVILLQEIPMEEVYKYWVAKIEDGKIIDMVEKPQPSQSPSNLMMPGMYILPRETFEIIEKTPINEKLGEIVMPEVLETLMKKYDIIPHVTKHKIWDVGNPENWIKANIEIYESGLV